MSLIFDYNSLVEILIRGFFQWKRKITQPYERQENRRTSRSRTSRRERESEKSRRERTEKQESVQERTKNPEPERDIS